MARTSPAFKNSDSSRTDRTFDPAKHPGAVELVGYPRMVRDPDQFQLYINIDDDHFLEIDPRDVLSRSSDDTEGRPRTTLWLKGSAKVKEVRVCRMESAAQLLCGRIAERHLKSAATGSTVILSAPLIRTTELTNASVCIKCLDVAEIL